MNKGKVASAQLMALNKWTTILVLGCAGLLFLDYLLPGTFVQTSIQKFEIDIVRGRGSATNTYYILTDNYSFPVTGEFVAKANVGEIVNLEVSRLLKTINTYGLQKEKETYTYYTRYLSGLFFPLALLLISLVALRLKYTSENTTYLFW